MTDKYGSPTQLVFLMRQKQIKNVFGVCLVSIIGEHHRD